MIEIRGLTKRFGDLVALQSLDLSIAPGEIFGFIGPNGAGKSTTMKILACLLAPDSGTATIDGLDVVRDASKIRRIIGYMPDTLGFYDDLTVDEYLQFFAGAFSLERSKRRAVIDSSLELTDLTVKRDAMVNSLSRGMQQRLGVARVLLHDPKVLLLDEPTSGLDPRARVEMRALLTELRKMGKSLLISSHVLTELSEMCTSIGIIERGKLLFSGPIGEAFARTRATTRVRVRLGAGAVSVAAAREALLGESSVASARLHEDGSLLVDLVHGTVSHHSILGPLLRIGAVVESFEPEVQKLEDVFLRITEGAVQ